MYVFLPSVLFHVHGIHTHARTHARTHIFFILKQLTDDPNTELYSNRSSKTLVLATGNYQGGRFGDDL